MSKSATADSRWPFILQGPRFALAPQDDGASALASRPLQRLDRDLAELDHASAVLQRERPFLEQAVLGVHGLLPVEHQDQMPSLGGDLVSVPLAAGLGHRDHLDEFDDRAGAVGRILALVEDVRLVAGLVGGLLGIAAAEEDAAVGVVAGPELYVKLEVLV